MAFTILLPYVIPLLLSSFFLMLALSIYATKKPATKLPPGPTKLPIIGNLHMLGNLPHRSLFKLSQKHGALMFLKLGAVPTVVVSSAETAEEFLKTHDLDCCTRPLLTSAARLSYGCSDVAFAPYGQKWRELRKICIVEFFSSKKILMFRSIRAEEVERLINSIAMINSDVVVNISAALLSLSNDITCRAALGKTYFKGGTRLHGILKEAEAMLAGFFFADYLPVLGWLDVLTGMRTRLEKNFSELDGFYEKVINEHTDPNRGQLEGREDTLDALLRIQKSSSYITREDIKAVLMDIFMAGSDTTSAAVEWTMTELIKNPPAMKKAQDEVRDLIGTKGKVEENDLPKLHYLKCVIMEAMRLHPPAPLLVHRETMKDLKIKAFHIPAGTRVIINAWAIGREEIFWENPEEFDPDRFIGSSINLKGHHFQLIPFGGGRRICPGMHIGLVVIELALANLLYSFNWELPEGVEKCDIDMDETVGVTVHRKSALRLVATKY